MILTPFHLGISGKRNENNAFWHYVTDVVSLQSVVHLEEAANNHYNDNDKEGSFSGGTIFFGEKLAGRGK